MQERLQQNLNRQEFEAQYTVSAICLLRSDMPSEEMTDCPEHGAVSRSRLAIAAERYGQRHSSKGCTWISLRVWSQTLYLLIGYSPPYGLGT